MHNECTEPDLMPSLSTCADNVLIQMAVEGRSDCFALLMERHLTVIRRLLRLMVSNQADLEDIVQEVLLKVWRRLDSLRSDSSLRPWMISVAINQVRQSYRRAQHRPFCQPIDDFPALASCGETVDQYLVRAEAKEAVHSAVAKLPQKYREVLVLRDLIELDSEETAQRLRMTIPAVKTRLFRARLMLSSSLPKPETLSSVTSGGSNRVSARKRRNRKSRAVS
jgi:RNA polymerase sigma-70 factor (ECF subfamily)